MSFLDDVQKGLVIWAAVKAAKDSIKNAEPDGPPVMIQPISGLKLWGTTGTLRMSWQRRK